MNYRVHIVTTQSTLWLLSL